MQAFKTAILVASLAALAGCASGDKSSVESLDMSPICPKTHGWQAWGDTRCNPPEAPKDMAAGLQAGAEDKDKLAAELAAARQRNVELERQLADRDKELAGLRGELSDPNR